MNRAALPDEEVVRTSQETGGEDCFAELFARHRQKVYSACRRFFADMQWRRTLPGKRSSEAIGIYRAFTEVTSWDGFRTKKQRLAQASRLKP